MGNVQINHTPTRYDAEHTPVKISYSYFDLGYADNYIRGFVGYRWEEQLYVFNIYDIRGIQFNRFTSNIHYMVCFNIFISIIKLSYN